MKKKVLIIGFLIGILLLFKQQLIDYYNCNSSKKSIAIFYYRQILESGSKNLLATNPKWEIDISFNYYYLLNCFKNDKKSLKEIDSIRHTFWLNDIKKEYVLMTDSVKKGNNINKDSSNKFLTSLIFTKGTKHFGTSSHYVDRDWKYIHDELTVSSFEVDSVQGKLKRVYYDPNKAKMEIKYQVMKNVNVVNLYFDYSDLDKETLQKIYNTISEMDYQKKYKDFTYHVFNNYEDKQLDVFIKYSDFGKWFDLKIM